MGKLVNIRPEARAAEPDLVEACRCGDRRALHCNEQARLLGGLRALSDELDATLLPAARERAIVGALSSMHVEPSAPNPLSVLRPRLLLAVALAAAFGVVLGLKLRSGSVDRAVAKPGEATTRLHDLGAAPNRNL